MSEELKTIAEHFSSPMSLKNNASRWGYTPAGYLYDDVHNGSGKPTSYRSVFSCDYCGSLVGLVPNTPYGDKNVMVVHAVHCVGITFGLRYIRAMKKEEPHA